MIEFDVNDKVILKLYVLEYDFLQDGKEIETVFGCE